jgi:hypothetical protein
MQTLLGFSDNKRKGHDNYPTPAWVTKALLDREEFKGNVLEPACGSGKMVKAMRRYLPKPRNHVLFFDLRKDRIYRDHGGIDFLSWKPDRLIYNIITNPPFKLAERFAKKALRIAESKVALLLRLSFLEGQGRYRFFRDSPLKCVYIFSERITFKPEGKEQAVKGSGVLAFGWYVWDKEWRGEPVLRWIEPGQKNGGTWQRRKTLLEAEPEG